MAKSTKQIAQRIDPGYHRAWHPLRRARRLLTLGLLGLGVLYMASTLLPGREKVFANGPPAPSHRYIASECRTCHVVGFTAVQDSACLQCHSALPHVPLNSRRKEPACTACHRDHGGDSLVSGVRNLHCNACHEAHRSIVALDGHMQFEREAKEQFLRFDHKRHIDTGLVNGPLNCESCHKPDGDGNNFAPIRFAAHCARCHKEPVEPGAKEVIPHGVQPSEIRDWVAAVLLRRMRAEGAAPARMRPGQVVEQAWEERTDRVLAAIFQPGRGCMLCHVREEEGQDIAVPAMPSNWFPKARFSHESHRFESCKRCHDMARIQDAETLEVPGVENCRECHRPDGANDSCVTCHPYHR